MDLTFMLELPSDPSTLNALTKYRALIDYLMNHPNVSDDDKLGLKFCHLQMVLAKISKILRINFFDRLNVQTAPSLLPVGCFASSTM